MRKFSTTEEFIEKAKKIHGDKYNYSLADYKRADKKINIVCPEHGVFEQIPSSHLRKCGCYKCGINSIKKSRETSTSEFIKKANKVHNNKFLYNKVKYKTSTNKVTITCPTHGDFKQEANAHLQGNSCPKCSRLNSDYWSYTKWQEAGDKSSNFDSFKVYIIKCWNDEEEFYKIGKTFMTLNKRTANLRKASYNYKVIKIVEGNAREISELERRLHKKFKESKYKPKVKFGGYTECFKIENNNF